MKTSQRLDYSTLAEILGQRGMIEPQRLSLALQTSMQGPVPFPETLVVENLIGDWELSRVVCDLYGLPFLPLDICNPAEGAAKDLDMAFLRRHRLVPLGRYGRVLVVTMPAMVTAEVLGAIESTHQLQVLPVVGTVLSNNSWLQEHTPAELKGALPHEANWSNLFDVGDAAVLMDLTPTQDQGETFSFEELPGLSPEEPPYGR